MKITRHSHENICKRLLEHFLRRSVSRLTYANEEILEGGTKNSSETFRLIWIFMIKNHDWQTFVPVQSNKNHEHFFHWCFDWWKKAPEIFSAGHSWRKSVYQRPAVVVGWMQLVVTQPTEVYVEYFSTSKFGNFGDSARKVQRDKNIEISFTYGETVQDRTIPDLSGNSEHFSCGYHWNVATTAGTYVHDGGYICTIFEGWRVK